RAREKSFGFFYTVDPNVPEWVRGDPVRLRQVLTNLVENGIKFTEKGWVCVACYLEGQGGEGNKLVFSVRDTGMGIPEDKHELLFEKFTQLDSSSSRKHGGTGLGLTISLELVALMGGRIRLESSRGKGAVFSFTIPAGVSEKEAEDRGGYDIRGCRIILVSNNGNLPHRSHIRGTQIRNMLEAWGVLVTESTPEKAVDLLVCPGDSDPPYDMVVVQMNATDALPFGEQVKNTPGLRQIPMVLVAGAGTADDKFRLSGFSARFPEPLEPALFREHLTRLVYRRRYGKDDVKPETGETCRRKPAASSRILVVEDNPVNQKVVAAMLKKLGYASDVAPDGLAALDVLKANIYDLIFMDCQMPRMDGYETTRIIRAPESRVCSHTVPVVAMTANAMPGDKERCFEAGMDDYMAKPITPEAVSAVVKKWLPEIVEGTAE
ncbi:MAG: ATP-binding protein, partial [Desulfobacterales bacterium]|nr:ATP-binding protein [Desulfobacterales bacterium]